MPTLYRVRGWPCSSSRRRRGRTPGGAFCGAWVWTPDNLKALECDQGQGYGIARPMPAPALLEFLEAAAARHAEAAVDRRTRLGITST